MKYTKKSQKEDSFRGFVVYLRGYSFLDRCRDRFIEDIESDIDVLTCQDERR